MVALRYVLTVIVPAIVRTGRRPVILSRYTGMGDIICTMPAARELVRRHPGHPIIYNCHPDFAPVIRLAGITQHVTGLYRFGVVGYWYRFLLAGFYHFAHGDDTTGQTSQASMVEEFCRQFDLPVAREHPRIELPPDLLDRARKILRERKVDPDLFLVIHPGPSWPVREWPAEKWPRLVAALREHGAPQAVQLGASKHLNFGDVPVAPVAGAASLVDALSLEETFAVIALAKLHIGIDSGLLHIAAAVGTPGIGIFGMTSPQFRFSKNYIRPFVVSRVECQGCYHRLPRVDWVTNCPHDIRCMKEIEVDVVLQACLLALQVTNPEARARSGSSAASKLK